MKEFDIYAVTDSGIAQHYIISANYLNEAAEFIESATGHSVYKAELHECGLLPYAPGDKYIRVYRSGREYDIDCQSFRCGKMSYEILTDLIGGYIEIHNIGGLSVICDEEGKLKGLRDVVIIDDIRFVGTVLVGKLTEDGLEGVSRSKLDIYLK